MADDPAKSLLPKIPPPPAPPGMPPVPGMPPMPGMPGGAAPPGLQVDKPDVPKAARAKTPVEFDENGFPKPPAMPKKLPDAMKAAAEAAKAMPPPPKMPPLEPPKKA